ncbi:DUF5686 and carboxypeptidase regulatory-like domain-containing protein [Persicitalea jodogahamensis]|uniref:Membrane protein n=1 Tax=Persicitalea jodogahamensis TaxID=402147 RepID=A0A8J3D4V0_9BACT|nr:DUF5686 and carboxypeptidase regulatory-like domain-containing protein [Persicitalea jodogahamensis]GHB75627.1 membrane protein [Persicitalea jodogahamensis]
MRQRFLFLFLLLTNVSLAGGVRGLIATTRNEPLPYAGIVVQGTSNGTLANAEGRYELSLPAGKYELVFQYLSFKTVTKTVTVSEDFLELNVILEEQPLNLDAAQVGKGKEDPAYSVMRRAIAKARFHQLQVRSYTARAYTRSTALPTKIPFLLERRLKKEGVQEGKAFLNESITEITYRRPNTYNQKILSTRNSLDNSTPTPNQYVLASFYSPEVGGATTPLSPKAFAYYRFEYEGFFEDRGEIVNKIKVIPKAYGEGTFRGSLYIIEDRWAIHSFDLETIYQGLKIRVKQLFSPVQNVWLPINQQFRIEGGYLGFAGEFKYVVSMNYQKLNIDPNLKEDITILDHKKEENAPAVSRKADLEKMIEQQKEFSTKNFRKIIKEYEKEEKKERKAAGQDVRAVRQDSVIVDSLANKRDTTYWETLRPVPLTQLEVKSYKIQDSVRIVRQEKLDKDSTRNDSTSFKPMHLLTGHTYKFRERNYLTFESPASSLAYNTVEGYVFDMALEWKKRWGKDYEAGIKPLARYALGRNRLNGTLQSTLGNRKWNASVEGGEYIYQFNPNAPISPGLNSLTTLLFEQNFLKIYQKQFLRADYTYRYLGGILTFSTGLEFARRNELSNLEKTQTYIDWKSRAYTPNRPDNVEIANAGFPTHRALLWNLNVNVRPWQKYAIRNGQKRYWYNKGPTFLLGLKRAIPTNDLAPDYTLLEGSIRQNFDTGPRSNLRLSVSGGSFLSQERMYFPDFRHFMGNEFFFQNGDMLTSFRMLPYYQYSTSNKFFQGHILWDSQRFVLTRLPFVRLAGLSEVLQVHYLSTPAVRNYTELVYGLDGIIRLFRVEVVGQFTGNRYQGLGLRVGTTLRLR